MEVLLVIALANAPLWFFTGYLGAARAAAWWAFSRSELTLKDKALCLLMASGGLLGYLIAMGYYHPLWKKVLWSWPWYKFKAA